MRTPRNYELGLAPSDMHDLSTVISLRKFFPHGEIWFKGLLGEPRVRVTSMRDNTLRAASRILDSSPANQEDEIARLCPEE
jgi:hypothetical protein